MGALVISRNSQTPTITLNPIYPTAAYTPPNKKAPYATAVNSDNPINSGTATANHLFILSFMSLLSLHCLTLTFLLFQDLLIVLRCLLRQHDSIHHSSDAHFLGIIAQVGITQHLRQST